MTPATKDSNGPGPDGPGGTGPDGTVRPGGTDGSGGTGPDGSGGTGPAGTVRPGGTDGSDGSGGTDGPGGVGVERFSPGALTLDNAGEKMRDAGVRIRAGGELVLDMSDSGACDSAALGAMIEWRRLAAERKCVLRFENIGGRLGKLARLYQVADLFGMGKSEGAAEAKE